MAEVMLRAGVARAVITPPVGIPMDGFAGRAPSASIHDELTATALVLEGGTPQGGPVRIALVCCDLLWLASREVKLIRRAITQSSGIPARNILISSSHNHYGPLTDTGKGRSRPPIPLILAYVQNLVHVLAGVVATAATRLVSCRLCFGRGEAVVGINRRERTPDGRIILGQNPTGPVDRQIGLLRIDALDGRPVAAIMNYACHAVSLGGECTAVSADFPGVAREVLERETGTTALYLQGAAGDINSLLMGWDWTHPRRLGLVLGAEAYRTYCSAEPIEESSRLAIARKTIGLPRKVPSSVEAALEMIASLRQEEKAAGDRGDTGDAYWAQTRLAELENGLAILEGRPAQRTEDAELTAIGIGDGVGLVSAPGEVFNEIGSQIRRQSPFTYTLYAGYTDGSIGYVPTRAAYAEGGYEVTHACRIAPEGGDLLARESVGLLSEAYARSKPKPTAAAGSLSPACDAIDVISERPRAQGSEPNE